MAGEGSYRSTVVFEELVFMPVFTSLRRSGFTLFEGQDGDWVMELYIAGSLGLWRFTQQGE